MIESESERTLIVGVGAASSKRVEYRLRLEGSGGPAKVRSEFAFAADMVEELLARGRVPSLLIFAPHSLSPLELLESGSGDLEDFREYVAEELLRKLERSEVLSPQQGIGVTLGKLVERESGGSLRDIVNVVPVESVGRMPVSSRHGDRSRKLRFQGSPLWIALSMILGLEEELSGASGPVTLGVELTHGLNLYIPILYSACEVVRTAARGRGQEVKIRPINWEPAIGGRRIKGTAGAGQGGGGGVASDPNGPELLEIERLTGLEGLTAVFDLARGALETLELGVGTELSPAVVELMGREVGGGARDVLLSLSALSCGLRVPALPLLHSAIIRLGKLSGELPGELRTIRDLRVSFRYSREGEAVTYARSPARGRAEFSSALEGFASYLLQAVRGILDREGLNPPAAESKVRREASDLLGGDAVSLRYMGLSWVRSVADFFSRRGWDGHLRTLCMEFGELLGEHCEWMREEDIPTIGVRYDLVAACARLGRPVIVPDVYSRGKSRAKKIRAFTEAAKNSRLDPDQVRHFRAHAGMIHVAIYKVDLDRSGDPRFWYLSNLADAMISGPEFLSQICPIASQKTGG